MTVSIGPGIKIFYNITDLGITGLVVNYVINSTEFLIIYFIYSKHSKYVIISILNEQAAVHDYRIRI